MTAMFLFPLPRRQGRRSCPARDWGPSARSSGRVALPAAGDVAQDGGMSHDPVQAPVAITETHISVLISIGDRVYKLKKPVSLGFLDFSEREARERACHKEVELNRRLAPDVYLGVADVVGVDGEPCDHLVVMRRMPADRRLAALVRA